MVTKTNTLVIQQGSTYTCTIRWELPQFVYRPITGISRTAPVRITSPGHGVPTPKWKVAITGVQGMTEINARHFPPRSSDQVWAFVVDADTIEINSINAAGYHAYRKGGYLQFNQPADITGYTARLSIWSRRGGTLLETMTTENGKIVVSVAAKSFVLVLDAATTAAYAFRTGVFSLEVISPTGIVTELLSGKVAIIPEITV